MLNAELRPIATRMTRFRKSAICQNADHDEIELVLDCSPAGARVPKLRGNPCVYLSDLL